MTFSSEYLHWLLYSVLLPLNRNEVKLRQLFSWIPHLNQNNSFLLSPFQFHNLDKVLHSKSHLHDISRGQEYLLLLDFYRENH